MIFRYYYKTGRGWYTWVEDDSSSRPYILADFLRCHKYVTKEI